MKIFYEEKQKTTKAEIKTPGTVKGLFFNSLLHFIEEEGGVELKTEISKELGKELKYIDFFDYPVQEYIIMQEEIVKKIFPEKTMEEGMYEMGRVDFKTFAESVFGKVVLPRLKNNLKKVSARIPSWYMRINKFGEVSVVDLGEKKFKLIFKDYKNYPQIQHGILRQAMETARRDEERVLIIQRASAVRSLETLHFLMPYLDQAAFGKPCGSRAGRAEARGLSQAPG